MRRRNKLERVVVNVSTSEVRLVSPSLKEFPEVRKRGVTLRVSLQTTKAMTFDLSERETDVAL
jgi:hypothetical protein